jgi:hypothetical protein
VDERDFRVSLTKRQPISWKASAGRTSPTGTNNPPQTQSDPFIGELKCIEIDPNNTDTSVPVQGNNPANNLAGDLKGEATIVSVSSGSGLVDARKYSAIGLQATGSNDGVPTTLQVGGPNAEYDGCPKMILLNTIFDDATVTTHNGSGPGIPHTVRTDLTVVPCSEDLSGQTPTRTTLQFLVFNEFEQRFSTSTKFSCFKEVTLSDIGGPVGPSGDDVSIFNFGVEGTLTGQIRIRPVASATSDQRVLAISEEFWTTGTGGSATKHSAAANTFFIPSGTAASDLGDTILIP